MISIHRLLRAVLILLFGIAIGAVYEPVGGFVRERLAEINRFVSGHPLESETTVWQKIQNDLGIAPWRTAREVEIPAEYPYQALTPATDLADLLVESELQLYVNRESLLLADHAGLLVKTQVNSDRGFAHQLLAVGFDGIVHRAISLEGLSECHCSSASPLNYFHIAGDPAKLEQHGNRLVNVNSCGGYDWEVDSRYSFHHYLNNDGDHRLDRFWVLDATDMVQLKTETGEVLQRISLSEIINANPNLPVFESRLIGTREGRWQYGETNFAPLGRTHSEITHADHDPFHANDVDEYQGQAGGLFEPGDLVLSLRSQNLLLVVRPATREIVWYAYGLTSRQHDPDFVSAESIMVYDNNFHNSQSRIVTLDALSDTDPEWRFGARRSVVLDRFDGNAFHQLTEGYQFLAVENRLLVFSAGYFNLGVDLDRSTAAFAIRHRWLDQAYLNLEVERLLSERELDEIKQARCQ